MNNIESDEAGPSLNPKKIKPRDEQVSKVPMRVSSSILFATLYKKG